MKTRMTQKQLLVKTKVRAGKPSPDSTRCEACDKYFAFQPDEFEKCYRERCNK